MASIEPRGKSKYRIVVSDGLDINGKQIKRFKTIELDPKLTEKQREKELDAQALTFELEVKKGLYLDGNKITFEVFIERWKTDYAEKQLAPKTYARYEDLLTRIIPAVGHIKIAELQPLHLIRFYDNLREKGIRNDAVYKAKTDTMKAFMKKHNMDNTALAEAVGVNPRTIQSILSGNATNKAMKICKSLDVKVDSLFTPVKEAAPLSSQTILHHHRLICAMLNIAVEWQVIHANPATRVKPPKVEHAAEGRYFEEEDVERMLTLLASEHVKYRAMIYVTLFTGCRLGELAALEWSDVDLDNDMIQIKQAAQYLPGKGSFIKAPKNESSKRIISLPPMATAVLREYKAWQSGERLKLGSMWNENTDRNGVDHNYIFTQREGAPVYPTTPSNWFRKFLQKNDLPYINFHGLRHTSASILIAEGVDIQTIAKRLGHTKPTTTTSIYSHFLKKPDAEAANKFEMLFNKDAATVPKKA